MTSFATNLRRLMAWHDLQGKDLAQALGTDGKTVSAWVNSKYDPSLKMLMRLGYLFATERLRGLLEGDPDQFGQVIADPDRRRLADKRIATARDNPAVWEDADELGDTSEVGSVTWLRHDPEDAA
jgi:transcriptional regulator with XRE-family HTH domain